MAYGSLPSGSIDSAAHQLPFRRRKRRRGVAARGRGFTTADSGPVAGFYNRVGGLQLSRKRVSKPISASQSRLAGARTAARFSEQFRPVGPTWPPRRSASKFHREWTWTFASRPTSLAIRAALVSPPARPPYRPQATPGRNRQRMRRRAWCDWTQRPRQESDQKDHPRDRVHAPAWARQRQRWRKLIRLPRGARRQCHRLHDVRIWSEREMAGIT